MNRRLYGDFFMACTHCLSEHGDPIVGPTGKEATARSKFACHGNTSHIETNLTLSK